MDKWVELVHTPGIENWSKRCEEAFLSLFGSDGGRYSSRSEKSVTLRAPETTNVPFAALIHPSNPASGPYGGMSLVLFPLDDAPALVAMVVGTQGLSPDENVLGRPGHSRKVQAICAWLNKQYGAGQLITWAKQDPVRIDQDIPENVRKAFSQYKSVFDRYGKVIYGLFVPGSNTDATDKALKAFFDLMFEERGETPLTKHIEERNHIQTEYLGFLMPTISEDDVFALLQKRRYIVLEGPPGTGKTRMARRLLKDTYGSKGMSIQFHPNVTYENFIGGLAPVQSQGDLGFQFAPQKGFLMQAIETAINDPSTDYLLHVDEINRSDLSKVLGEAIFLLETHAEDRRDIQLPYDFGAPFGSKLSLPGNLHILGTMNSADRSIAIVDVAIRRRFAFVKLWPQMSVVQKHGGELMQKAFRDLLTIFVEHASDDSFSLVPGHSYFLIKDDTEAAQQLQINLAPLLEEYLSQGYVSSFSGAIRSYLQWIKSLS